MIENKVRQKEVKLTKVETLDALIYWAKTRHIKIAPTELARKRIEFVANTGGCCPCSMHRLCPCDEGVDEVLLDGSCKCSIFMRENAQVYSCKAHSHSIFINDSAEKVCGICGEPVELVKRNLTDEEALGKLFREEKEED